MQPSWKVAWMATLAGSHMTSTQIHIESSLDAETHKEVNHPWGWIIPALTSYGIRKVGIPQLVNAPLEGLTCLEGIFAKRY